MINFISTKKSCLSFNQIHMITLFTTVSQRLNRKYAIIKCFQCYKIIETRKIKEKIWSVFYFKNFIIVFKNCSLNFLVSVAVWNVLDFFANLKTASFLIEILEFLSLPKKDQILTFGFSPWLFDDRSNLWLSLNARLK